MLIRPAEVADASAMVTLSERARSELEGYSPIFWRKAEDSAEKQLRFFRALIPLAEVLARVAERSDDGERELLGFVIARLQQAPPVYGPGGPVCLIDDFCVASHEVWADVGSALLADVESVAKALGAVLTVVVCPHLDAHKRSLLATRGFEVTAEWHVRPCT